MKTNDSNSDSKQSPVIHPLNIESKNHIKDLEVDLIIDNPEDKPLITRKQQHPKSVNKLLDLIHHNLYFVLAISAAISFGLHSYLVGRGMHSWNRQTNVIAPEGFMFVFIYLAYHGYIAIQTKMATGVYWNKSTSVIVDHETGKIRYMNLGLVFFRGIGTCLMIVNVALITIFAKEAGVSPAVMLSLVAMTSFMGAVAFYFLFKEKLRINHMVGMVLIMLSVVVIAVGKS